VTLPGLAGLPRRPAALLLDFDGVILDSAEIKTQAFAAVYHGEAPEKIAAVVAYQRAHGGVSRREKFAHFEREIFGRAADPARIERLAQDFARIAFDRVLAAPYIPGAEAFLKRTHAASRLYLVSGTPQDELTEIVAARGLAHFFRGVVGAPTRKREAFAAILGDLRLRPDQALAVGDATTELDAAAALGIPFLAVVGGEGAAELPRCVARIASMVGVAEALGFD
jgi:HAD superfamily hydrolase (TIGR01509 family)